MPQRASTRFQRTKRILECGLMPNFATGDGQQAICVAMALHEGGCPLVEFLNRGPGAAGAFAELAAWQRRHAPGMLLGAGTITEPATAAQFIHAGAEFIVAPNFNIEVAAVCHRLGIPYIPGCGTATEMSDAMASGVDIVKFFPAPFLGGPAAVRALLGPFPHALVMPSGGVETDEASLRAWFGAGVAAVSVGGALVSQTSVESGDWDGLSRETARVMELIRTIRA
jgi:2-dehydro-3-deoxyphosphogluconate aldolase/(4S)-4-hydroxy-2-oxoglutarate aldolase